MKQSSIIKPIGLTVVVKDFARQQVRAYLVPYSKRGDEIAFLKLLGCLNWSILAVYEHHRVPKKYRKYTVVLGSEPCFAIPVIFEQFRGDLQAAFNLLQHRSVRTCFIRLLCAYRFSSPKDCADVALFLDDKEEYVPRKR